MLGRQVAGQTDDPAQAAGAVSSLNLTFKESLTRVWSYFPTIGLDRFLESESLEIDSFPWFYVNNAGIDSFLKESQCNDSFQKYEMAWFFAPDSFLNL